MPRHCTTSEEPVCSFCGKKVQYRYYEKLSKSHSIICASCIKLLTNTVSAMNRLKEAKKSNTLMANEAGITWDPTPIASESGDDPDHEGESSSDGDDSSQSESWEDAQESD